MNLLTIITPTYNRAELLPRCYASLCKQTNFHFEWIIVDDGSTDNTETVVSEFSSDRFPIVYIKKPNGGKHTALNASHPYIHGDYVLILDSDDFLVDSAVEQILTQWREYQSQKDVGIITFQKGADENAPNCIVKDYQIPVDIMTYPRTYLRSSDACEVIRTSLFVEFPFPELDGERFISECALWDRVSFVSKCVYIDSVIYICEYLDGGLTKSGRSLRIRNPKGGMFTSNIRMDRKGTLKQRIKNGILYTCYAQFAALALKDIVRSSRDPFLAFLCAPAGNLLHMYWAKKYGGNNE